MATDTPSVVDSVTTNSTDPLVERFRPLQTAPTAMILVGDDGRILMTNERLERMFGYATGELLGDPVEALVPSAGRAHHVKLREAYSEFPVTRQMGASRDLYGVTKSGRHIPVEIGLTSFHDDGRNLVLAFILDLTERKRQEEKFRMIADASANGLVMIDSQGRIALANSFACTMFGFEQQELIGQSIEILLPDRYRTRHQVFRHSYTETPEPRSMGQGRDLFARRKDGSEFPVEIGLMPLEAHDGRFIVSTVIDITERKRVERETRERNQQLSLLNDELLGFAYSVSHDLKAPLLSIRGLANLALEELDDDETGEIRRILPRIEEQADHLSGRIESVLALARADHLDDEGSDIGVADLVSESLESIEHLAEGNRVRITTEIASDVRIHTGDVRLSQIVENLVTNGIKYCDPAEPEPFVEISAAIDGSHLKLTVRDNGVGIPEDCHPKVFGMFQRFETKRGDGSGLGLALVKKHVDRMGGEISFTSSPGGTTFKIRLPNLLEGIDGC